MALKEKWRNIELKNPSWSTVLVGGIIGFLGAAVLYSKSFPSWVPFFFTQHPWSFFGFFAVTCAALGYVWSIVDD